MLKKIKALPLLASLMVIEPMQAFAQQSTPQPAPEYYGPGPWQMWDYGYGWHVWGMLPMMIFFFVLACIVIFAVTRMSCGRGPHRWGPMNMPGNDPTHSALEILNERFARGEIQKDEYTEKKSAILSEGRA